MSKSDSDRFDNTITNLPDTKAAGYALGTKAVTAIQNWIKKNGANKVVLGGQLSLGGIHIRMSEAEKYTRHLKRGIMLAYLTIGGGNKAGINALKNAFKHEKQQALRQRLQAYETSASSPATINKVHIAEGGFGKFEFSKGSWKHANTSNEHEAAEAFAKASALVNKAVSQGLPRLGDPVQKARFELWFGSSTNAANVNTVKKNLKKVHDAICNRTVKLYFRGNNKIDGEPTDLPIAEPWSADGAMHKGDYFGAAWPVQPGPFDQTKTHMLLGEAFFSALRHGSDCCAGVIIHELSHSEAQTSDHPNPGPGGGACYGHDICRWIATNRPDLAVTNADNHEFYCEEFWEGTFKSKPQQATNPIPDTDKRHVKDIL